MSIWGFPGGSAGKESTCKAGDPGEIPGLGKSPGEGIGYPFQYSWASLFLGFPGGSDGKESTCNVGDLGSNPGLGKSPGEGIGYLLQYSWASLMAHIVKNLPATCETWF